MSDRAGQLDMPHAFTAHLCEGDFNTTLFTNNATMFQTLVFTTQALVIVDRAKDFGAKEAITLWLEGTIVYGLWFFYFAIGPGTDHIRRCQANTDGIEVFSLTLLLKNIQ
jgi:hypothetical protein